MERITEYRTLLQQLMTALARTAPGNGDIETVALFDQERDQYQVREYGWNGDNRRVFAVLVHARIRDGRIWIEREGTAPGIAAQLVAAGVPHSDIVLAFYPAWKRAYTDFAAVA